MQPASSGLALISPIQFEILKKNTLKPGNNLFSKVIMKSNFGLSVSPCWSCDRPTTRRAPLLNPIKTGISSDSWKSSESTCLTLGCFLIRHQNASDLSGALQQDLWGYPVVFVTKMLAVAPVGHVGCGLQPLWRRLGPLNAANSRLDWDLGRREAGGWVSALGSLSCFFSCSRAVCFVAEHNVLLGEANDTEECTIAFS